MRPLLPTGAVTRNPDWTDHHRIRQFVPTGDLELSIYGSWDESVIDELQGLPFVTAHADKRTGATLATDEPDIERFRLDCRIAGELGVDLVVLHLWELPIGDRELNRNLDRLPGLIDIAEEHDIQLTVETIPCSVGTPIENVLRACERDSRCRVTVDTEFLAVHNQLGRAHELGELIAHVHVKDYDPNVWDTQPRRYLLPGEGVVDIEGFLARLPYDGTVTLEMSAVRDDGSIDVERLEAGGAWLRRLI